MNGMGLSPEPARWTDTERAAFYARRESRNRALGLVLFALVVLFFGITVVRMTGQVPNAPAAPTGAAPAPAAGNLAPAAGRTP
jgi:hypothetical protein